MQQSTSETASPPPGAGHAGEQAAALQREDTVLLKEGLTAFRRTHPYKEIQVAGKTWRYVGGGDDMFSFKKFLHYWWGSIIRPVPTLKQLVSEPSLSYPFAAYFLFGLLYGLFALVGYFSGHTPAGILVNFISAKEYYLWEGLFMIPVTMQIYITFAALAHLFARLLGGKGSFEATLSVLGFTYSVPLIVLFWIPDVLFFSFFGSSVQLTFVPLYGTAAGLWTLIVSVIGIKIAEQLSFPRALLVTLLSMGISFAFLGGLLIR